LKIAIYTSVFSPSVGGQETLAAILASEFQRVGHNVTVLCETPIANTNRRVGDVRVLRHPLFVQRLLTAWGADVAMVFGATIIGLLPFVLARKKVLVSHQNWLTTADGPVRGWTRKQLLRRVKNCAASEALSVTIPAECEVLPNTYDHSIFTRDANTSAHRDIIFVGRLIREKGCDDLINALSLVIKSGRILTASIVGSGPQEKHLRTMVSDLGLEDYVDFLGPLLGAELAKAYQKHTILVVPSVWEEPFGIVALEGIACGCYVIGTAVGGLPAAIGPCGSVVSPGNPQELATKLIQVSRDGQLRRDAGVSAGVHLAHHSPREIAGRYLRILAQLVAC